MMTTAEVRLLEEADLDNALALSSASGWNQRAEDWRMLLTLAPTGSFAAVHGKRIVGTAVGIDYRTFGWIAMMLVAPEYRGRGLGARLLEAAMGAVPHTRPIRLDATPLGRPLYQRYGFEHEATLTRYVSAGSMHRGGGPGEERLPIRLLDSDDLAAVATADGAVFGATRSGLLEWMQAGAPQYAHAIAGAGLRGYCFGRHGRLFDQIGPVVAPDDGAAWALVDASLGAAAGRAVVVDAFERAHGFSTWLQGCGFSAERPLFRMCRPGAEQWRGDWDGSRSPREFAILGPELG